MRGENIMRLTKPGYLTSVGLAVKRIFDVVFSACVLLLLGPFFGLIGLAIKKDSPGPVFFRGNRIGKNGQVFRILKFRTMYETPASYQGPRVTAQDDARITPLGGWLRDTKLNELPQFWNVLRGDMSVVGPRPEDPLIAKTWPRGAGEEILSVRPGITSPASVLYRNEETILNTKDVLEKYLKELSPDKLRLDQLYVRYRSFWLDLDIVLWTFLIMLPKIVGYSPPEEALFLGPISRLTRRYMNWLISDFVVVFVVMGVSSLIWRLAGPFNLGWAIMTLLALGIAFAFSLMGAAWGVNRINWDKAALQDMFQLLPPWLLTTVILVGANAALQVVPLGLTLIAALLSLTGFILTRYRQRWMAGLGAQVRLLLAKSHAARERALIVGSGRTAEHIAWVLNHPSYSDQLQVVGFIDDDPTAQGMRIYGARIIGTLKDLPRLLLKHDIGLVILADHRLEYFDFIAATQIDQRPAVKVLIAPDIYGSVNLLVPGQHDEPEADSADLAAVRELPCRACLARRTSAGARSADPKVFARLG